MEERTVAPNESRHARPSRGRRRWWLRAVVLLAAVFLLTEGVLRFGFGLGNPPLMTADPEIGYLFQPDQKVRRFGNWVEINAFHQRTATIPESPPNGELRVMCVGDSVTWGGVLTDQSQTYPELLASELRDRGTRPSVQALNASAGSWGLGNELAYLRRFGVFGSRHLVLQIGSGDLVQETSTGAPVGVSVDMPDRKPALATGEVLQRYFRPKLGFVLGAAYTPPPARLTPDEAFRTNLQHFRDCVAVGRSAGAVVLVVHTPERAEVVPSGGDVTHDYDFYRADWLVICKELDVPVVNLVEEWRRTPDLAATYYRDSVHPNAAGNAAIAGAVARVIP